MTLDWKAVQELSTFLRSSSSNFQPKAIPARYARLSRYQQCSVIMSREQWARILGALSASLLLGKGIAGLRGVCGSSLGSPGHVSAVEREGMPVPLVWHSWGQDNPVVGLPSRAVE